jgi:NTP pyrophosphatase (non-canonical NTP hydrolase)
MAEAGRSKESQMSIDEYAAWASAIARVSRPPTSERLSYLGLGLAAEAGEVADHIKKFLRDRKLDEPAMIDELGDVVYYWACLCVAAGRKPSEVLAASKSKIERKVAAGK